MAEYTERIGGRLRACELLCSDCPVDGLEEKQPMYGFRAVSQDGKELVWPAIDVFCETVQDILSVLWKNDVLIEELPYIVEDYIAGLYMVA